MRSGAGFGKLRRFSTRKQDQVLEEYDRRVRAAFVFILAVFALLVFRLWSLQFPEQEKYLRLARRNYLRTISEPALRGRILDRSGRPLAENIPVYDLVVNWEGVPRPARPQSIERLAALLEVKPEEVERRLKSARPDLYGDRTLEEEIDFERVVAAREARIPGVRVGIRPRRFYPYGPAACHLIGFLGEIGKEELQQVEGYRQGDWVGKLGLERHFEFATPALRGKDGFQRVEVYAHGLVNSEIPGAYEPSVPGKDVWTTLDLDLQLAAERILGASKGAIVAMAPTSGDILAVACHPAFDPNVFVAKRRAGERAEALQNQFNLALNGVYAMGSIFKAVVATAALEEGAVTPQQEFHCAGRIPVGSGYKHCHIWWKYQYGHGDVDLPESLQRSCDVYYYKVGQKLGHETILRYAREVFGLVDPPGYRYRAPGDERLFSLVGEEPDPGRVIRARLMRGPSQWFTGDTLNLAIGQGELACTPLQVAVLMSVLATRGSLYQPRLVSRVSEQEGGTVMEFPPQVVSETRLKSQAVQAVWEGLRQVINTPRGTAYESRIEGLDLLGKTGTAEKGTGKTDAWFACFAPGDATPEIALAIVLQDAGHGGEVAAPLAKALLEVYFAERLQKRLTKAESLGRPRL